MVRTDRTEYNPGATVSIEAFTDATQGPNFTSAETLQFQVTRTDGIGIGGPTFEAVTDATGAVDTTWVVDPALAGTSLQLTARGLTSGAVAATSFRISTTNFTSFTSNITPDSDTPNHFSSYSITVAAPFSNDPTREIESISIAIPNGYSAVDVTGIGSVTGNRWHVQRVTSSSIELAPNDFHDELNHGESITVGISAMTPSAARTYEWTTTVPFFSISGRQPTVTIGGTELTLSSSNQFASYGDSVTFTAKVQIEGTSTPVTSGSVQFYYDVNNDPAHVLGGPVALNVFGQATSPDINTLATPLPAGTHVIFANYLGTLTRAICDESLIQVINRADPTIRVNGYNEIFSGVAWRATGTATGAFGESLAGLNLAGTVHVDAGIYLDTWTFTDTTGNYKDSTGRVLDRVTRANAEINVSPYSLTYDGNPHVATASATGVRGESLSGLNLSDTIHTDAGNYIDMWSFNDPTGNYNDASGIVIDHIGKADATIIVTPYSVPYDNAAHVSTGSATGVRGEDLGVLTLAFTIHRNVGTYTDIWLFTDTSGNYQNASGTVVNQIVKAAAAISVVPYNLTYDGEPHTSTGTATGINGEILSGLSLSTTTHRNAGSYSDTWTFTDSTGNYADASGTVINDITKADATIQVVPYNLTYDGNLHTATGTAAGVNGGGLTGLDLSATTHANAGTFIDTWTFTDSTGNYNDATGTVTDNIARADATINVFPYGVTYDGNPHTATGTATGINGEILSGLDLAPTTHTDAGSYVDTWTFTDSLGNYNTTSGTVIDRIDKANATISVVPYSVAYDGNPHTSTGTAIGINGEILSGLDLSATTHTNAGTYADTWTFIDPAGNYNDASGTVNNKISRVDALINVTRYDVAYDGSPHTSTGSAIGVNGEILSGLDLNATTHTNAGVTIDPWAFTDSTGNYNNTSGSVINSISRANVTINVIPYSVTYDGSPHVATGTATGVGGADLSAGLNLSGTTHSNAGTYSDQWTFTDSTGNYNNTSGTVADSISRAQATINVIPYNVTFDGISHTSTGTATGVGGVDLSAGLDLGRTTHSKAGSYSDPWTFTDSTGNYSLASGLVLNEIARADAVISVTSYNLTYNGLSHTATGSATGIQGELLNGLDLSGTTHTNAGSYLDSWTFTDSTGNYKSASGTVTDQIARADATVNVIPYSVTYDGSPHTATGLATGAAGEILTGLDLTGTTHTNAGSSLDSWTFTDSTGNYKNASGTVTDQIARADAAIVVIGYSVPFDGVPHTATGTATGIGGIDLSAGLDLSGTTHTAVGAYTDPWAFTDSTGNYNDASGTVDDAITTGSVTITITGYHVTYDGAAHTATGIATGPGGIDLSANLILTGTTHTNAGTYTDTWTFHDPTGTFADESGTVNNRIDKAGATIVVNQYSVTYDGTPHTATGSVTGVLGESLSGLDLSSSTHTNARAYLDAWTFTDSTGNYSNDIGILLNRIARADATIVVNPYSVSYDGTDHTATGSATGIQGESLSGLDLTRTVHGNVGSYTDTWTFSDTNGNYNDVTGTVLDVISKADPVVSVIPYSVTYDGAAHTATGSATGVQGEALTGLVLTGTTHTNAGSFTDTWTFTDSTGNYNDASGSVNNFIARADATIIVDAYSVTYDGSAHIATGSVTGVSGESLHGLDLSGTTHTNAGSFSDTWTFTDSTGNYNDASGNVNNLIARADATIIVDEYSVTYDGSVHTATGSVTGVHGEVLSGLDLSGTTHTNAGSYSDTWTFTDATGNYNDASGQIVDEIARADAAITVNPYSVTYDGTAHTSTGSATGILGEILAGLDLTGTTHTGAGTFSDTWTFTDPTGNYNDATGQVANIINQAEATIVISPYNLPYDGAAHTASGSATGVLGESLAGLDLTVTTHTNAGVYTDAWTFTDSTGNYRSASGQVIDVIARADATITVVPYSATYNGASHTATGSVVGAQGEALTGLDLSGTTHTNAGSYTDTWTFTDVTGNYNSATGSVNTLIAKADATIDVTAYNVTYDGVEHTVAGTVTGVEGEILTGLDLTDTAHTNAGSYSDAWTFIDSTGNYNDATGSVNNVIVKADATISVIAYNVTYSGASRTATGSVIGARGETLEGLDLSGTTHTDAGSYADDWTFTDANGNYNDASGTVLDLIARADATITVAPYSVTYDGAAHASTGSVTGVQGEILTGLDLTGTTHTDAGIYSDLWTFTDSTRNYNDATGNVSNLIERADATIIVDAYNVTYDGTGHVSTGSAFGVHGEALAGLVLTATAHADAGSYADDWKFTDSTGNYNNASGTVFNEIARADAVITVDAYTVTYDGAIHTATGSVTGVLGESLAGLNLTGTIHTKSGAYTDPWTFVDSTGNYNFATGVVLDRITQADATIGVTPYNVPYDGAEHTATGSAAGVQAESLSGLDLSGTMHINAAGYTDAWLFTDSTGNYSDASGLVFDEITRVNAVIVVTPYSVTYDGKPHSATGTVTGVNGESVSGLGLSTTTHTNAGSYSDSWTFTDPAGNYNDASGTVQDNIARRNLTVTATGVDKVYDGTTTATVALSDNRIPGDVLADSYSSANFSSANPGTWPVTVTGISISGAAAGNYQLVNTTATTTAKILAATAPERQLSRPTGLAGFYFSNGRLTEVLQNGSVLKLINAAGTSSSGTIANDSDITAPEFGVTGVFDRAAGTITFSNGSVWNKVRQIEGKWLTSKGGVGGIRQLGTEFEATNGAGIKTTGHFVDATHLVVCDWKNLTRKLTGVLTNGGTRIEWANGDVWNLIPEFQGDWVNGAGKPTRIEQQGDSLLFVNAVGQTSLGKMTDAGHLQVGANWGNVVGNIVGNTIQFANGTLWSIPTLTAGYPDLGGLWETSSGGLDTRTLQADRTLTFVNRSGQTSAGEFLSPTEVFASDWNSRGRVVGNTIVWDSTVWTKIPYVSGAYINQALTETGITQLERSLTITEFGIQTKATLVSPTKIKLLNGSQLTATISGDVIKWIHGPVWTLLPRLSGNWHVEQLGAPAYAEQAGLSVLFITNSGSVLTGKFISPKVAMVSELGTCLPPIDVKVVNEDTLEFRGGMDWTRFPPTEIDNVFANPNSWPFV